MRAEKERDVELCLMGAEWRYKNMNPLEVLSTHFDNIFTNPILKGNRKCIYYSTGNANGFEDLEILSQNTITRTVENIMCAREFSTYYY